MMIGQWYHQGVTRRGQCPSDTIAQSPFAPPLKLHMHNMLLSEILH